MDISIIIPTYNRAEELKKCLDSLFKQDYPKSSYEILVIDDGSIDKTKELLSSLSKKYANLRYLSQSHKGPAAARNLGIHNVSSGLVSFTDDDCILASDWVRKMVEAHNLYGDVTAIGGLTKAREYNIKAVVSQSLSDGAIKTVINGKTETIFLPTCNVSFKRKYLEAEFNESFFLPAGEDLDFFWRIFKSGRGIIYKPDIEVLHDCHPTFKSFLSQAYRYGRGNYLVQHIHKNHPLLKEIKIENNFLFLLGLAVNFFKIPRFSYFMAKRLFSSGMCFNVYEKFQIYLFFTLHKIVYLLGNCRERMDLLKKDSRYPIRIYQEARNNLGKPRLIILDITHKCNLLCNICEIRKDASKNELATGELKNLISQAIFWGIEEFVLSGGEPLLREDIFEILDFVQKNKYHLGILTNGILLNKSFIDKLSPYLISGALSLTISLDSLTPARHDGIRGVAGSFQKTSSGLKIISELKNKYPNINFNVITIILNENLEELLPLANVVKSLNANSLQFQPLLVNNLVMKERAIAAKYWIPQERLLLLERAIDDLIEFKSQNSVFIRNSKQNLGLVKKYFQGTLRNEDVKCANAIKTMLIADNGKATTCFSCYGDTRKQSLESIYFSKEAENARDKIGDCKNPCLLPCFTD